MHVRSIDIGHTPYVFWSNSILPVGNGEVPRDSVGLNDAELQVAWGDGVWSVLDEWMGARDGVFWFESWRHWFLVNFYIVILFLYFYRDVFVSSSLLSLAKQLEK